MGLHPHALAFDRGALDYERGRPGYPRELLDWMVARYHLGPDDTVVDLGAGTGKLTRLLCEGRSHIVAVEPLAAMRRILADRLPGVELHDATAEGMPLADASVDLVACGQSFRWFATEAALGEIARVLVPQGICLLVFNHDAESGALGERFQAILRLAEVETGEQKPGLDWHQVLASSRHFSVGEEVEFPNPFFLDQGGLTARLRSSSQFTRLPEQRRTSLIAELEAEVLEWPLDLAQVTTVTELRKSKKL